MQHVYMFIIEVVVCGGVELDCMILKGVPKILSTPFTYMKWAELLYWITLGCTSVPEQGAGVHTHTQVNMCMHTIHKRMDEGEYKQVW